MRERVEGRRDKEREKENLNIVYIQNIFYIFLY